MIAIKDIEAISEKVKQSSPNNNDFVSDGLLHCGKCGTQKQCYIEVFGIKTKVNCICQCHNDKLLADRLKLEEVKKLDRISRLRTAGIQDKAMTNWTFENDNAFNPSGMGKALSYANKWEQMYSEHIGIIFWGGIGTGKTYAAASIANRLINQGIPVMMTDFAKILNQLSGFHTEDKNAFINDLNSYKLLIIDDLGVERNTPFALENVFNIVNSRYKNGQPIIFTTNLTLKQLQEPQDVAYSRIYDRILEMCVPIKFEGESMRKSIYREKLSKVKQMLENNL